MNLSGNNILITGGTSGLGLAMAEAFLQEGSTVIITGRRTERLKQIKQKHPSIITKENDVSTRAGREELYNWTVKNYPAVNMLINNAGVQYAFDFKGTVSPEKLSDEIDTNLTAPIHLSALFTPHLSKVKNAAIINISSGLAFAPLAFMPVYCSTKAALHSFTLSLRHQLKATGIKVFEIAPSSTDTELGHDRRPDKTQTHGGMPISEFLVEAMEGIKNDMLETIVADAKGLRAKGEQAFGFMNK